MGVRTLVGEADGTTPAAAMYDSQSGFMFGPIFEGEDAPDRIEGFQEWLRRLPHVRDAEAIGLTTDDLPRLDRDGADARDWPDRGLKQLVAYYHREVWNDGGDDAV